MSPLQGEEALHQGKLILDATVAEQAIRYPTDRGLLNEAASSVSRSSISSTWAGLRKKPRTYRERTAPVVVDALRSSARSMTDRGRCIGTRPGAVMIGWPVSVNPMCAPSYAVSPTRRSNLGRISVSLTGEGLARVDHLRWDAC